MTQLYERKLKVFDAIALLLGEQQRRNHPEVAEKRIKAENDVPDGLRSGFEMTQIPMRIFKQAAVCARLHGDFNFTLLDECVAQDGGYAQDVYHPRFIAVLLIIGDGLDLDNDRFHPFMEEFCGEEFITENTKLHISKHHSVESLYISPKQIRISADCKTPEALRILCNEIEWLQKFLKNCNYYWNEIAPESFHGSLPNIVLEPIKLAGKTIPADMVTTRFAISQEKAFSLLQGSRIYNHPFTFLREMIQNACDATKLQYWEDYTSSPLADSPDGSQPQKANGFFSLSRYPIYIDLWVKKQPRNGELAFSDITAKDLDDPNFDSKYKTGVLLEVQDGGIGISKQDIEAISKVGTSHGRQKKKIQEMPGWLRPTGHFGVGLQSLFLICNQFQCVTKTRGNECYHITFHSRTNQDGYINVVPCTGTDENGKALPYGSKFSLFIDESHKESHRTNMDGWVGVDPYSSDYARIRSVRRAAELLLQLDSAVDDFLGEMLFPIRICRHPLDPSLEELSTQLFDTKQSCWENAKVIHQKEGKAEQKAVPLVSPCWLYNILPEEESAFRGMLPDESAYLFDARKCQLHIWSQKMQTFFVCSSQRIHDLTYQQNLLRLNNKQQKSERSTRLFIKGLFVCNCPSEWVRDTFIQEIDIKSDVCNEYLQMNRDGLTAEGGEYLRTFLIPSLVETLRDVLRAISRDTFQKVECRKKETTEQILQAYESAFPDKKNEEEVETLLAAAEKKIESESTFDFVDAVIQCKLEELIQNNEKYRELGRFLQEYLREKEDAFETNNLDTLHCTISASVREQLKVQIKKIYTSQPDDFLTAFVREMIEKIFLVQKAMKTIPEEKELHEFQDAAFALQQQAFLCALALFEVGQTKKECMDGCVQTEAEEHCIWAYLNGHQVNPLMDSIEKYFCSSQSETETLGTVLEIWHEYACIPIVEWSALSTIKWKNIAYILDAKKHFAVFSTRSSSIAKWRHMLVEISERAWKCLNREPVNEKDCDRKHRQIDAWCHTLIENMVSEWDVRLPQSGNTAGRRRNEVTDHAWENLAVRWMVHAINSIALASDRQGMNRLNVLSIAPQNTIFKDSWMIQSLLERMQRAYIDYGVERFQTLALDGLAALNIKETTSTNIIFMKRGCVSPENKQHRMLTAFQSSVPQKVGQLRPTDTEPTSVYDVFRSLQKTYSEQGRGRYFLTDEIRYVWDTCERVLKQVEWFKNADDRITARIRKVQEIFLKENGDFPHHPQDYRFRQSQDMKQLLDSLQDAYEGLLLDSTAREEFEPHKWSDVPFAQNFERLQNTVILRLFNYNPFGKKLSGLIEELIQSDSLFCEAGVYRSQDEFMREIKNIVEGLVYVGFTAEEEVEDIFIRSVLEWWKAEIWSKDKGHEALLKERRSDLLSVSVKESSDDFLEHIYLRQIEYYLRALIANCPSPLQLYKSRVEIFGNMQSADSELF